MRWVVDGRLRDEWFRRLAVAAALAAVLATLAYTLDVKGFAYFASSNAVYMTATALAACAALRAVRWPLHSGARAALVLGLGLSCVVGGDVAWAWYEVVLEEEPPFPSIADVFYISGYLTLAGGVLLLPTRPLSLILRGRIVVDGLIAVLSVATLSWYFYLGPMVFDTEASPLAYVVGVTYPLVDILLIACLYLLTNHGGIFRVRRAVVSLQAALILLTVFDTVYGITGLSGYYPLLLDVPFVIAFTLIGLAGLDMARLSPADLADFRNHDATPELSFVRVMLPYALCVALGGLLVYVLTSDAESELADGVYAGATACILVVLIRQMMALRENVRLYQELHTTAQKLQELATTDGMTGLANHRTMQEALQREMAARAGTKDSVSMLLIDVDRFKAYNDTFGHLAGDDVLRELAQLLRANVRPGEMPARYGGEEFAVVLPGADRADATRVAERIRAAIESHPFANRRITVSIGVATASAAADTTRLLHAADDALYEAKRAGGNRVVAATALDAARRVA